MKRSSHRRGSEGFTYVEVTAAMVVLVIGVLGFAGTVVYTRNLDRATTQLSVANAAATATLEDVREDSAGRWASLGASWDGRTAMAKGASNATNGLLKTTVKDDPSQLDSGDGMWTAGQLLPNYYHVSVIADSAQNEARNALNFQTYVADRTGFRSLVADPYSGPPAAGTQADAIDPAPRNVTVTGTVFDNLQFQLMNGSATPLKLRQLYVSFTGGGSFVEVDMAGTQLYDNPLLPKTRDFLTPPGASHQLTLNPGLVDVRVRGVPLGFGLLDAIFGQTIKLRLKFADDSQVEVQVQP